MFWLCHHPSGEYPVGFIIFKVTRKIYIVYRFLGYVNHNVTLVVNCQTVGYITAFPFDMRQFKIYMHLPCSSYLAHAYTSCVPYSNYLNSIDQ